MLSQESIGSLALWDAPNGGRFSYRISRSVYGLVVCEVANVVSISPTAESGNPVIATVSPPVVHEVKEAQPYVTETNALYQSRNGREKSR